MKKINTVIVAGARPNFMKVAPIYHELKSRELLPHFCHTGQHEDYIMSDVFIKQLGLPIPDYYGVKTIPENTKLKTAIIVGDLRTSYESAMALRDKGLKIVHVEAGLRSFDPTMPEEFYRIQIDRISSILFATEESAVNNLQREGIKENVYLVGNVMIDSLQSFHNRFILLTLHRPSNVDKPNRLDSILEMIDSIGIEVVYPVHPGIKISKRFKNIIIHTPMPYEEFVNAMVRSSLIVTDSGGVQEEAAWLRRQCITLRENTERPITKKYGNRLCYSIADALRTIDSKLNIPLWDGSAAKRIVNILINKGYVSNETKGS